MMVDGPTAANIHIECQAVARFFQQTAFEGAQNGLEIGACRKPCQRFLVRREKRDDGFFMAQHFDQQFVQVQTGEQLLARQMRRRNQFALEDVHQLPAPAPSGGDLRERFDVVGAAALAPGATDNAGDAAEIARQQFDDGAGLSKRALVQDEGGLAFGSGDHVSAMAEGRRQR